MSGGVAVKFKNVSTHKTDGKEGLYNVSFSVNKGDSVAFLLKSKGALKNNSILDVIIGNDDYTFGIVRTDGRIKAIANLDKLFNMNVSGRKNIYLRCSDFGIDKLDIELIKDEIIKFTEIENKIDDPLKSYSEEMRARLALAIILHVSADIIAIDYNFELKNEGFIQKCKEKINELQAAGRTFLLFTNKTNLANKLCRRGIVVRNGRVAFDADIDMSADIFKRNKIN